MKACEYEEKRIPSSSWLLASTSPPPLKMPFNGGVTLCLFKARHFQRLNHPERHFICKSGWWGGATLPHPARLIPQVTPPRKGISRCRIRIFCVSLLCFASSTWKMPFRWWYLNALKKRPFPHVLHEVGKKSKAFFRVVVGRHP